MLFLWLVLIQFIIFAFLIFFLKSILTKNITHATTHLHDLNQDYNHKLEDAKKKSAEADRYYDEMLLKAKTEAEKAKVQILKETHENQEALVKEARKQSEEIIQQAQRAREEVLKEIEQRIDARATEKASEIVEEILPKEIGKNSHTVWVDELIARGLGAIERMNLSEDISEAEIVSAYALSSEQKAKLQNLIKSKLKRELKLKEEISPALIAGLKITIGSVVIDGSLSFRIKEYTRNAYAKR